LALFPSCFLVALNGSSNSKTVEWASLRGTAVYRAFLASSYIALPLSLNQLVGRFLRLSLNILLRYSIPAFIMPAIPVEIIYFFCHFQTVPLWLRETVIGLSRLERKALAGLLGPIWFFFKEKG